MDIFNVPSVGQVKLSKKDLQRLKSLITKTESREPKKTKLTIDGKEYKVHPKVMNLLDGEEGIHYMYGEEVKQKVGGSLFVDHIKTLKKSDPDFEKVFVLMYNTTFGKALLMAGYDYEEVNPSLGRTK